MSANHLRIPANYRQDSSESGMWSPQARHSGGVPRLGLLSKYAGDHAIGQTRPLLDERKRCASFGAQTGLIVSTFVLESLCL